jgi:protein ImuA
MLSTKKDIIQQLQKDLLLLQGFKSLPGTAINPGLGIINNAFPNKTFPTGAIHEFISDATEQSAATSGFVAGLLASFMKEGKVCVWIGRSVKVFPPALKSFGVEPEQIIFIDLQRDKDLLWAMEEALKCEGLATVVGEINEINFTASRRLQLAVEKSRVTGFLLRQCPRTINTIACVARWKIISLPGKLDNNMPGVGFPRWNVELLKVRNGKPGAWQMEWINNRFQLVHQPIPSLQYEEKRKAG